MKKPSRAISLSLLFLLISAVAIAQGKKQSSPFDKYRQSSVNEFEFRKLQFEVEAMRASLPPNNPLPSGVGVPFIAGEGADGKLIIEVQVWSSDLPQTVDARKEAMMEAIIRADAGFSFAFYTTDSGMLSDEFFKKWCVVQFSDNQRFVKSKAKKPVDPVIGIYENGELVLR